MSDQNGARDIASILASRYWLTDKGEAAVAEIRAQTNEEEPCQPHN